MILNPLSQVNIPRERLPSTIVQQSPQDRDLTIALDRKGNVLGAFGEVGTVPGEAAYSTVFTSVQSL